jgi:hypothetical protein
VRAKPFAGSSSRCHPAWRRVNERCGKFCEMLTAAYRRSRSGAEAVMLVAGARNHHYLQLWRLVA